MVDWEQLLECVRKSRWDYDLRAAYFNLLNTLHLEHEVYIRRLIQGDFIFAVGSKSHLFDQKCNRKERRPSLQEQSIISHEITSSFSSCQLSCNLAVPLEKLKEIVFSTLESILRENTVSCRMLSSSDRAHVLVPLLTAINNFLMLGMIGKEKDRYRLLELLHPSLAKSGMCVCYINIC